MLRDVTEQRRAQVQIVQQQRSLAVLQERERLARELHDSLGQVLAATHVQAATASLLLGQGQVDQADQCMRRLADTTLEAEADVRDYLLGAKTIMSPDRPFFAALREYLVHFGEQHDLPIQLTVPPELEAQGLPQAAEVQLQRIIQEALSNVRKHSGAAGGQVIFTVDGGSSRRCGSLLPTTAAASSRRHASRACITGWPRSATERRRWAAAWRSFQVRDAGRRSSCKCRWRRDARRQA